MITYKHAGINDIELLVELRIKELAMFSDIPLSKEAISQIRRFYQDKMNNNNCLTILAYDKDLLVSTGTIYYYDTLPSNNNPIGITGQITNIWTHPNYRRMKIASNIMYQLMDYSKDRCGLFCLNSSDEGVTLYHSIGFVHNEKHMILKRETNK